MYHPLQLLAEHVPHIAWIAGPDGSTEYTNRRCQDYLGLSAQELNGWTWHWSVHPADLTRVVRSWRFAIRAGEPCHVDCRLRRADGVYRWHVGWALPLRDTAGQLSGWFTTCSEVEPARPHTGNSRAAACAKNGS